MKNVLLTLVAGIFFLYSCGEKKKADEETVMAEKPVEVAAEPASVFFKHPADGATVASPVFIEMGVSGMQIEPAGAVKEGFGHHHILIIK